MTSDKSKTKYYFLGIVIFAYLITWIISPNNFTKSLIKFYDILLQILPTLLLVFFIMFLTTYFVKPQWIKKHMGKSGIKGYPIAIISGIISSGPIYMWYPLLNDLQQHGVKNGLIATFLYNRAVKIPLLPMLIYYFGATYTIILTLTMIFVSILQGIIINKMEA